ncbi:sugar transferase [Oscillospiraceae bacterium LTW-04]|nr:sugar transferase [Oscillospiraceae bacterium MB24-C1]
MLLPPFAKLPFVMQNEQVQLFYQALRQKQSQLVIKRIMDILLALFLLLLLAAPMAIIAVMILAEGNGGVLFRQQRITQYMKTFTIYKFRTMAPQNKPQTRITVHNDDRITALGRFLRRYRLDELPQLFNILNGDMSFVGPRPELDCFVAYYDDTMLSTLLLPAGLTSQASLKFCDETKYLDADDSERVYKELLLPRKMALNVAYITHFSLGVDIAVLFATLRHFLNAQVDEFDNNE